VDTGRGYTFPAGAGNPFEPGEMLTLNNCIDIVVDSARYERQSVMDFEVLQDDRKLSDEPDPEAGLAKACGLTRVFVQVHQRGRVPAKDVRVNLYVAANKELPRLPEGFSKSAKAGKLPSGSAWTVAGTQVIPALQTGRPQIVRFDWQAPAVDGYAWLLAIVSSTSDPVSSSEHHPSRLVLTDLRGGLKQIRVLRA